MSVLQLATEAVALPRDSLRRALGLQLRGADAWTALVLAVLVTTIVFGVVQLLLQMMAVDLVPRPFIILAAAQVIEQALMAFVLVMLGRLVGSAASLDDIVTMLAWVQLGAALPSGLIALICGVGLAPQLLGMLAVIMLTAYLTVVGLQELQTRDNVIAAVVIYVATLFIIGVIASMVLGALGFELQGMA